MTYVNISEIRYIAATSINSKKGLKFSIKEDTKPESVKDLLFF